MDVAYPTIDEPATPEYVLAVIQDWRRLDGHDRPDDELTFETPVNEWIEPESLWEWKHWAQAINHMWGLRCKNSEWKPLLRIRSGKCMFDVCEFIAARTTRPRIREARLLGRPCLPGGAFLTVRSLLAKAGANAEEIGPSTELAPFTRLYYRDLVPHIIRLSPGVLPPVRVRHPVDLALLVGSVFGFMLLPAFVLGNPVGMILGLIGAILLFGCWILSWSPFRWAQPRSVEIGNLRTFRDLAIAMTSKKDAIPEL